VVRLVRFLPHRLRALAPEAVAFGVIGLANLGLYYLIFNALIFIGAVKSTVIATLVTTYLAYLANRHWTYKDRPRSALRREYTLFFAVNMGGLLIQSAGTGILKYGFDMSETHDRLAFNIATTVCICTATLFRFWTYRTFVFAGTPATAEADELPVVAPAEGVPVHTPHAPVHTPHAHPVPAHREPADNLVEAELVDAELELATDEEFGQLTAELSAELKAGETPTEGAARIH
jgi:putative flippase GtrA